ncbi:MAG: M15 family metallopeptidase [Clostridia bacterium]|nr:M15 family metallopeptidase [Clostridia bacterium]MBR6447835.1 M15 family metallopeptidase [Methanomicrobium sp.]
MRGIEFLIPEAQEAADEFSARCWENNLDVKITDTLRSEAEQNALYAQGRTMPGEIVTSCRYPRSLHNWGVAFDFCRNERGREYDDGDGFFERCGAIAESLGLVWGGNFKKPDRPHIQLAKYSEDKTAAWLIETYERPALFMAERRFSALAITPELAMEIVLAGIHRLASEPADEWAENAMLWAYKNQIYKGDKTGNLMPKKPVTREELAQALMNYRGAFENDKQ